MPEEKTVIIIGGGAAGFFAAINLAERSPTYRVIILEKSTKLLSKVRISGGGRCNVTHHCHDIDQLTNNYPRGSRELRQVFSRFAVNDTVRWFEEHGVMLKTETDGRMFPVSDNSETIVKCFTARAAELGVIVKTGCEVYSIKKSNEKFRLASACGEFEAGAVICAMGGHPKSGSYRVLQQCGHTIIDPVPSLFTFNMPSERIKNRLQGLTVQDAVVTVDGTRLRQEGPLLITHWGMSGPAILKLSAYGAVELHQKNYSAVLRVNWTGKSQEETRTEIEQLQQRRARSKPYNTPASGLPARLWEYFCDTAGISRVLLWADVPKKQVSVLASLLYNGTFNVEGKTTFKEEFVTCGGIDLREADFRTMESRIVPGLYLCGEVLNIDGVTGGFNFQAAWSTAWLCARSAYEKLK